MNRKTRRDDMPTHERQLFIDAMCDVRPHVSRAVPPDKPKLKPSARFSRADQLAVLEESLQPITDPALLDTGDELSFRRDHVLHRTLQRLRRGEFSVRAEIDLHGLTAIEARAALAEFIHEALLQQYRCVRIVHGKGKRSGPRGPVLKNVVNRWLRQCDAVQAFGSARPIDGGSGAVYVLLV